MATFFRVDSTGTNTESMQDSGSATVELKLE
jgi:hypothetical protein